MRPQFNAQKVKTEFDKNPDTICYIDIRGTDQFSAGHVPGSTCIPLDQLENSVNLLPKEKLIVVGCQGGVRSEIGADLLRKKGFKNVVELEGGYLAWARAGLPVATTPRPGMPIMRQVQLTAGALVFFGTLFGTFINAKFLVIPLFVGAGLSFAGATGWCGMAMLLGKMPWNKK